MYSCRCLAKEGSTCEEIEQFGALDVAIVVSVDLLEELSDVFFGEEFAGVHARCQEFVVVDPSVFVSVNRLHNVGQLLD